MKLLIVDDNPHIRKIIRRLLEHRFDHFFEAENGFAGVEVFDRILPDWTIADIEMDEMDGLMFSKTIKHKYPNAKIIVVSDYKSEDAINPAEYCDIEAYFPKDDLMKIDSFFDSWGKYA